MKASGLILRQRLKWLLLLVSLTAVWRDGWSQTNPPVILTQPVSAVVTGALANVTFRVTGDGSPPLQYQWQFNGTNISNATNDTLALNSVLLDRIGTYAVALSNDFGAVTSSNASLLVTPLVWIPDSTHTQYYTPGAWVLETASNAVAIAQSDYTFTMLKSDGTV